MATRGVIAGLSKGMGVGTKKSKGRFKIAGTICAVGLGALIYSFLTSDHTTSASDLSQINVLSEEKTTAITGRLQQLPQEKSSLPIFLKDGWNSADAPPPDEKLLGLSPDLLADRAQEIYEQLSSGAIGPRHIDNMIVIFAKTTNEKIRYRILENLATLNLLKAEQAMIAIYPLATPDEKAMLVGLLHPLDHQTAHNFLVHLCNDPNSNEQKLALTALASIYIFSGNDNFQQQTLSQLSDSSKITYLKIQNNLNNFTWAENKERHAHAISEAEGGHE
ncbi:MAG: hypothetical protein A2X86_20650 [Bdellovibrionales bacterium GWA2_49_15]|nr:MAG: hypothetical protein A2X86_20650 [Bdellovibrionales bacterium GWA2_49_15]HAZ11274.1 hypothetical protein [Bdellovibrionales bacterium]